MTRLPAHPPGCTRLPTHPQLGVDYLRSRMPMMTGKTNVRPVDGPAMANGDKHQAEDENDMTQKRMVLA